jgi:hypothetical protein
MFSACAAKHQGYEKGTANTGKPQQQSTSPPSSPSHPLNPSTAARFTLRAQRPPPTVYLQTTARQGLRDLVVPLKSGPGLAGCALKQRVPPKPAGVLEWPPRVFLARDRTLNALSGDAPGSDTGNSAGAGDLGPAVLGARFFDTMAASVLL